LIGILGGTGLYRMDGLQGEERLAVETPFGAPSAEVIKGVLAGREVAFLARHGPGHEKTPSEINYRANVWALKAVGVRTIIGVSAVGSLRAEIRAGEIALPTQYIDFTRGVRVPSFFGGGVVAHVSTATPVCAYTAGLIADAADAMQLPVHRDTTYACVEGPRLGTRAESFFLRGAGADLVGMTNVPEVFLACEAQLGYATIALVTDYDCWLDDPAQHVTLEQAMAMFHANLARVQQLIVRVVGAWQEDDARPCRRTLAGALVTPRERMTDAQRAMVDFLAS
jgi:5'-methylthioadenosine phosphorylase